VLVVKVATAPPAAVFDPGAFCDSGFAAGGCGAGGCWPLAEMKISSSYTKQSAIFT
jgi:hypothetical protein